MKKVIVLIVICFVMLPFDGVVEGQNVCYNPTIQAAKSAWEKGDYERAQKLYDEASDCFDATEKQKIEAKQKSVECKKRLDRVALQSTRTTSESTIYSEKSNDREIFTVGGVKFTMVWIEGGSFTMGCTQEQGDECRDDERPKHEVKLSGFYMGETEVTQALWTAVMGSNPSYYISDSLPVNNVSWNDIQEFLEKLNILTSINFTFSLPTEAEWEYAARGSVNSRGYRYSGSDDIYKVAWFSGNNSRKAMPVGQKQANEVGLYDMSGNLMEWCYDCYGKYKKGPIVVSRSLSKTCGEHVLRGGCYCSGERQCRVTARGFGDSTRSDGIFGFRLIAYYRD